MVKADEVGFPVSERVLTDAALFLLDYLEEEHDAQLSYAANTRAFILYVLAEAGYGDLGRTVALYEQRERLALYGKAYLALALNTLAPDDPRVATLVSDLVGAATVTATSTHWQ